MEKENEFAVDMRIVPNLEGAKVGFVFKGMVNYQIAEVTKSYCMIRVKYFTADTGKRKI